MKNFSLKSILRLFLAYFVMVSCSFSQPPQTKFLSVVEPQTTKANLTTTSSDFEDEQIEIVKQQVWENLQKMPGTERDYTSKVSLSIGNGNIIDAECTILFPKSSWEIASIVVDDYKDVLKNTNSKIFAVIYRLITDSNVLASEIYINGLWRPWLGSHVHIQGRGIDIGYLKSSNGDGTIFNYNNSQSENDYAAKVRECLTINFSTVNQYLSPWYICNPPPNCSVNNGVTDVEKGHRDHLHLTLSP